MDLTINKVAAGVVGLAMVAGLAFAFTATRVHATTLSELVELFIALEVIAPEKAAEARAALAGMAPATPGAPAGSVACTGTFSRDLKQGSTGADVMELQKLLNARGFTVATGGAAGSPGMETQYYGPATAGAVTAMQTAYAGEILAPLGLTMGTGYFGASTRAKANALCSATTPTTPTTPTIPDDDGDEDADEEELSDGEASVTNYKRATSPSNAKVAEGDSEKEVAAFQFDVKDADVAVRRAYVRFEQTESGVSYRPWDYFREVHLMVDGEIVAEADADSRGDWEDLSGSNAYEVRFTGLNEIVRKNKTGKISVAVTMNNRIDSADESAKWAVSIPDNGVRARDGKGIDHYVGDKDITRTFDLEAAGQGEELRVALASSNPKSSIIKVSTTNSTNNVAILVFTLEARESDIEIREIPVLFTTSDTEIDTVVSDVRLEVDGTVLGDLSNAGVATTSTFEFDSNEFVVEKGDKVTIKVMVDLLQRVAGNYAEGTTLSAQLSDTEVAAISAEGASVLTTGELKGTAVGETHALLTQGIFAEIVSITETSKSDGSTDDAVGEFKFVFDVTAFENTYYISASTTAVFDFDILDANGASSSLTDIAASALTSSASKVGNSYRIDDGSTRSFTLTVTVDPGMAGFYRAQLNSIDFGGSSTNTTNMDAHTVAPVEDFESDALYLNN